jgi:hypothetical protein
MIFCARATRGLSYRSRFRLRLRLSTNQSVSVPFRSSTSTLTLAFRWDTRSGRPNQATLLERIRASLDGRLVIPVIQEMQRSLSVMLGIEGNINAGSRQR